MELSCKCPVLFADPAVSTVQEGSVAVPADVREVQNRSQTLYQYIMVVFGYPWGCAFNYTLIVIDSGALNMSTRFMRFYCLTI